MKVEEKLNVKSMLNKSLSPNQKVDLLIHLLNEERTERWKLGIELHAKIGYFTALKKFIELAIRKFDKGILVEEDFNQLMKITDTGFGELRELQYEVFPAGSRYNGLIYEIQKEIIACRKKYNVPIEFTCIFDEDLNVSVVQEVAISNICAEIVTYFCHFKPSEMAIRLDLHPNRILEVQVQSLNAKHDIKIEMKHRKLLNLINAKLVWQHAKVLPDTNWIDCCLIDFVNLPVVKK